MKNEKNCSDFVELRMHPNYEISINYPDITIRNKTTKHILKQCINASGYLTLSLNRKTNYIHKLVAEQYLLPFLENIDTKLYDVDHINHDKLDNRPENLRYVSHSFNLHTRKSFKKQNPKYKYPHEIDIDLLIPIEEYNNELLENYYYDKYNEKIYRYKPQSNRYKVIKPSKMGKYYITSLVRKNRKIDNKISISTTYNKLLDYCKSLVSALNN